MHENSARWHEVSVSDFAHEKAGLDYLREQLPDREPFHAWSNFEFRDRQGRWAEVDLLVLGEGRLHLVELKHYQGRLAGTEMQWQRGARTEDTPLRLARRKAQRLSSELKDAAKRLGLDPGRIPFVQECVFLHAPNFECVIPPDQQADMFGFDHKAGQAYQLPSILDRLLEPARLRPDRLPMKEGDFLRVMDAAGFTVRQPRTVGSWKLDSPPLDEGDDWQDWPAKHAYSDDPARIRFFTTPSGSSAPAVDGKRHLVKREFRLTQRLRHDGVLSPRDVVEFDLGAGLVFPYDPADQRLDLWLADHGETLSFADRIDLVRQLGEALQYAHANGVVHRGLAPMAVTVHASRNRAQVLVGDWRLAGLNADADTAAFETQGQMTRIQGMLDRRDRSANGERASDAYLAPEGAWSPDAHRVKLDVFALGALTYFIVTGRAPAANGTELKQRLAAEQGLDLAADLPEAPAALRSLVLAATTPKVSERLRDTSAFLEMLSTVERDSAAGAGDTVLDPLDAPPGTLMGDRFELIRRLGSGSSAVGLLVTDQHADGARRVLKVARDDTAARRLADEAEVLVGLNARKHPRLVRIVDDAPVLVGERTALVLESAGEETLADVLRDRRRLSLDLLDRWGTDLLEAVVALDAAGVDHRDIKPANLGVREQRGDRAKHLVLFDFSLSRASASSVEAGTPPYLDPFLGLKNRTHWDSAAERYAAAVTLFEMATGHAPVYGDGASDPAVIDDDVTVTAADFDPALSDALVPFFRTALARDSRERFGTAAEMHAAWRAALSRTVTTDADDADVLAAAVAADTPLAQSGLTPRALSALEPFGVATVADLIRVDLVSLRGVVDQTRREIRARAKQWRERFGADLPDGDSPTRHDRPTPTRIDNPVADPHNSSLLLLTYLGKRATKRLSHAAIYLGVDGDAPAFATLAELAGPMGLGGQPQVSQALSALRAAWSEHAAAADLLDVVAADAVAAIADLDGVAWADDLVAALARDASQIPALTGLVRAALDVSDDRARAADEEPALTRRRRRSDNRLLLATSPALVTAATAVATIADRLVAESRAQGELVVTRGRSIPELRRAWPATLPTLDDVRLLRLAARMSSTAAASAQGELYARDLDPVDAVRLAFGAVIPGQRLGVEEVQRFVAVRFPGLQPLPPRPDLDGVLRRAGTGLEWDGDTFAAPSVHSETTFVRHTATQIPVRAASAGEAPEVKELRESITACSFLALNVPGKRAEALAASLCERFAGVEVNVTDLLLDTLRAKAEAAGIDWSIIRAADAAEPGSRDAQGLAALVAQSIPTIEAAIDAAMAEAPEASRPVIITDAAPLARYGHMALIPRLADVTRRRANAVWLVVPRGRAAGPMLDGETIQLSYGSQFVTLEGPVPLTQALTPTPRGDAR